MSRDRTIDQAALAEAEAEAAKREAATRETEAAERETEAAHVAAEQQEAERQAALAESRAFWDMVDFAGILTDDGCEDMVDEVGRVAAHDTWLALSEYESSKERDAAIRALEKCRSANEKARRKLTIGVIRDFRKDYGVTLEDAYDEANPYDRGDLVSTVRGTRLTVTMSGGFAGRVRHTEAELNRWCGDGNAMFFSNITLKSKAHGTFSCVPVGWPGSDQNLIDSFLDEDIRGPWSTSAGDKRVPPEPESTPDSTDVVQDLAAD